MDSNSIESEVRGAAIPLYSYQMRWVCDASRFKVGLWSRQTGKSFATSLEAVLDCFDHRCDWVFLSSGERQSIELMRKAKIHAKALNLTMASSEDDLVRGKDGTVYKRLAMEFANGSRILALPANPDTARGHSANVVLDEFAFHQDSRKIWASLFPTITRGYKIRIISTPQGKKNKFYEIWTGNTRYAKHFVDIYKAVQEGLIIYGNEGEVTGPEYLREGLDDEEAWQQEYECQFLDEATAFLTYELISEAESESLSYENEWKGGMVVAGIDVGRKKDRTVYWALEIIGDVLWTMRVLELETETFSNQFEALSSVIDRDNPRRICVDCGGLGMQLAEDLQSKYGKYRVEQVFFRNTVKEEMAVRTKRVFEDHRIRIPIDRKIREDLHSIKKVVTPSGNTRFDADRTKDGHSDRFWALSLAITAGTGADKFGPSEILVARPRNVLSSFENY